MMFMATLFFSLLGQARIVACYDVSGKTDATARFYIDDQTPSVSILVPAAAKYEEGKLQRATCTQATEEASAEAPYFQCQVVSSEGPGLFIQLWRKNGEISFATATTWNMESGKSTEILLPDCAVYF